MYKETNNGSKFLLFNNYEINGPTKNRILIFCTSEGLKLMSASEHWFADGTFKSAHSIFTQIYTIHVLKYNTVIPVVFALLPDKSTATYSYLIKTLKSHIPLNPKTIMTDFEQSAILAFKENFPNIISRGCHFHLSQCV
uniref:MULE transposase domain-containing protein n=1 Tax=Sipha flava TaxID=143950 RepID=A0A2S2QRY9_9HEMI